MEYQEVSEIHYLNFTTTNTYTMNSIQITSLPLGEVIADIALAFNTTYTQNCGEFSVSLPPNIGSGKIKGINFEGGLGIINYDCTFYTDMEIQFIVNSIHPLKFLYILEGSLNHRFANEKEPHLLQQYQHAIVASCNNNGHILTFKANEPTCLNSLEVERKIFRNKMKCELEQTDSQLSSLFKDTGAVKTFYYKGNYSLEIADLFREMQAFKNEGITRKIFLEGICYHMLTREILQYEDALNNGSNHMLRRSEVTQIEKAARIIETEINSPITIEALARRIGLNINKLQNGFHKIYNITVNGYVQKYRLDLSKKLLLNTDYSISEIVERVGLTSKSYFSKLFKTTYSLTPTQYRKHHRNTYNESFKK